MSNQKTSPGRAMAFGFAIASVAVLAGAFSVLRASHLPPFTPATFHAPRLAAASAVRRERRLLGGEGALKSAPKTLLDSASDRNREA